MKMKRLGAVFTLACGMALCVPQATPAKEKRSYQKGLLMQMESTTCGFQEKSGKGLAGTLLGTDAESKKTREMLCPEYVLRSDRIIYRIRPKEEKKPRLLPVGEEVEFRIHKDKLLLRVPEEDDKEREYYVTSMTPRQDLKDSRNGSPYPSSPNP